MALADDARSLRDFLNRGAAVPDAFMLLFHFIENSPNGRFGWLGLGEAAVSGRDFAQEVGRWRDEVRERIGSSTPFFSYLAIAHLGEVLSEIVASGAISRKSSKSLVIALRVLDSAFLGVHPAEVDPMSDALGFVALRTRVRMERPLFEYRDLRAYPKPRRVGQFNPRGQGRLTELLANLVVVAAGPQLQIVNKMVFDRGTPGPQGFRRFGVVPTISEHGELKWTKEENSRYSVGESPLSKAVVHRRVSEAIGLLVAHEAELVLMPELVSSPELTQLVSDELFARDRDGQRNPHFVLAGTHLAADPDGTVRNRALILDSRGNIAWQQDKLNAYRFTAEDQTKAGNPLGEDDLVDRIEAIDIEPRTLFVVDVSPTQRIVILTCEDFAAADPHRSAVADIAATTILVPIMSGERSGEGEGWINDAAMNYVKRPGATCVIANSGALLGSNRQGWQYGHVVATTRVVQGLWTPLPDDSSPIAWLADVGQTV